MDNSPKFEGFVQNLLDRLPLEDVFERLDIVPLDAILELHDTGFIDLSYYSVDDNDTNIEDDEGYDGQET